MISSKKILQLARKWQRAAAIGKKRISLGRMSSKKCSGCTEEPSIARKGHFAVYTTDGKRFEVPLSYLAKGVIRELFVLAEEEFGISGEGPIVLPLDASSLEYIISTIRRGLAREQEKTLLLSFARCSSNNLFADMAPAFQQVSVCN
ncbi:hypothetical protein MLD38_013625 [Melastoma candidum]|uniref:Uncharacterized protein n=1 Tax=Melastoma candidum TaxID=119954 RepID=A0ACB9RDU5_9MYRT|nr:hypothetical protein MLD38_013625 [Melastoma candidum]